eukprot:CAMPEP_0195532738 /NCGR_PEP_ID=MMETSP0794_2-20130614/38967_1 /TAXON_ID=515487 /ORGANISM="Stephanopyxis turris, Strain CCMP 815" /LENGTH=244 /DNA_ID=CAMNT_0040665073 /DNA_START=250 /DNA_END=984 /DNA_ORIENTATION=+
MTFVSKSSFFLTGVVAGVTLGAYLTSQFRRQRIRERMRASYLNWLNQQSSQNNRHSSSNDSSTNENQDPSFTQPQLQKPIPATQIKGIPLDHNVDSSSSCGATMRIIASPDIALTSSLHGVHFTLPPKTRTRPREAKGVEIYYVLHGSGVLMRDGGVVDGDSSAVCSGDVTVVNPWSVRWIENKSTRENLTFLRVADGGNHYSEEGYDAVVMTSSSTTTTMDRVMDGIKSMGTVITDHAPRIGK